MVTITEKHEMKSVNVKLISFQNIIYSDFNNSYTRMLDNRIDLIDVIVLPLEIMKLMEDFRLIFERNTSNSNAKKENINQDEFTHETMKNNFRI